MKISGVAIGQWNQICKKKEGIRRTKYKIYRAIVMGKVAHIYASKDYITRYYDMNILVSHTGLVLTVWRDNATEQFKICEKLKAKYDTEITHKDNAREASIKHVMTIVRKELESI